MPDSQPDQPPKPRRRMRPPLPPPPVKPVRKPKPKPKRKSASKTKPPGTAQQRAILLALSQTAAALLIGMTPRGLQKAEPPAPRNGDGSYDGPQLVQWLLARRQPDDEDPLLAGEGSPHLERYRSARASLAELELGERQGQLINIDALTEWWATDVAAPIRRAIDALAQQFGPAAAALITAALAKAETAIEAKKPSPEESVNPPQPCS